MTNCKAPKESNSDCNNHSGRKELGSFAKDKCCQVSISSNVDKGRGETCDANRGFGNTVKNQKEHASCRDSKGNEQYGNVRCSVQYQTHPFTRELSYSYGSEKQNSDRSYRKASKQDILEFDRKDREEGVHRYCKRCQNYCLKTTKGAKGCICKSTCSELKPKTDSAQRSELHSSRRNVSDGSRNQSIVPEGKTPNEKDTFEQTYASQQNSSSLTGDQSSFPASSSRTDRRGTSSNGSDTTRDSSLYIQQRSSPKESTSGNPMKGSQDETDVPSLPASCDRARNVDNKSAARKSSDTRAKDVLDTPKPSNVHRTREHGADQEKLRDQVFAHGMGYSAKMSAGSSTNGYDTSRTRSNRTSVRDASISRVVSNTSNTVPTEKSVVSSTEPNAKDPKMSSRGVVDSLCVAKNRRKGEGSEDYQLHELKAVPSTRGSAECPRHDAKSQAASNGCVSAGKEDSCISSGISTSSNSNSTSSQSHRNSRQWHYHESKGSGRASSGDMNLSVERRRKEQINLRDRERVDTGAGTVSNGAQSQECDKIFIVSTESSTSDMPFQFEKRCTTCDSIAKSMCQVKKQELDRVRQREVCATQHSGHSRKRACSCRRKSGPRKTCVHYFPRSVNINLRFNMK